MQFESGNVLVHNWHGLLLRLIMNKKTLGTIILIALVTLGILFYKSRNGASTVSLPADQIIQKIIPKEATNSSNSKSKPIVPKYDHIVIVILENKPQKDIMGNKDAPYINSLAKDNALATNYTAITNPSLPNYLALIGGSTFGIKSDCTDCFVSSNSLVDQLEQNNKSWKAYMESMPSP
jgi:hypothetical protein